MGRDRNKGRGRGGPKVYISNVEELVLREGREQVYKAAREARRGGSGGAKGEEEDEDEVIPFPLQRSLFNSSFSRLSLFSSFFLIILVLF